MFRKQTMTGYPHPQLRMNSRRWKKVNIKKREKNRYKKAHNGILSTNQFFCKYFAPVFLMRSNEIFFVWVSYLALLPHDEKLWKKTNKHQNSMWFEKNGGKNISIKLYYYRVWLKPVLASNTRGTCRNHARTFFVQQILS